MLESVGEPAGGGRRWLLGILSGVGALLVLIVALRVNDIADYMVSGSIGSNGVDSMWRGDTATRYTALRDELRARPAPAEDEIVAAMTPVAASEEGAEVPAVDGFFVVLPVGATASAAPLGVAAVRTEEDGPIFVAILSSGEEVRGRASLRSTSMLTAEADHCAMFTQNTYMPVYGFASREESGSYALWGQFQVSEDDLLGFVAYRLP